MERLAAGSLAPHCGWCHPIVSIPSVPAHLHYEVHTPPHIHAAHAAEMAFCLSAAQWWPRLPSCRDCPDRLLTPVACWAEALSCRLASQHIRVCDMSANATPVCGGLCSANAGGPTGNGQNPGRRGSICFFCLLFFSDCLSLSLELEMCRMRCRSIYLSYAGRIFPLRITSSRPQCKGRHNH